MKLLIVEDNVSLPRLIVKIVAGLAEDIRECGEGVTAVEAYLEYRPAA